MNAINPSASSANPRRQTRLVIVRANAPLFYSLVLASFFETDAAGSARRLAERLGAYGETAAWIEAEWVPAKESRSHALRLYIEQCWPEFDWSAAYDQYRGLIAEAGDAAPYRRAGAREALAHCLNTAQAGLYYRALGRWSDDHALRALARAMAQQEASGFEQFRRMYEHRARREGAGLLAAWRATRRALRHARDTRVRLAFQALNAHLSFNAPFPILDYSEFLRRMHAVIQRCATPVWAERFLFNAWRRAPQALAAPARSPLSSWFRPVLSQAA